jgi:hypothetical protein
MSFLLRTSPQFIYPLREVRARAGFVQVSLGAGPAAHTPQVTSSYPAMRNWLKNSIRGPVWDSVVLGRKSVVILTALWLLSSAALEALSHRGPGLVRDWGSVLLTLLAALSLSYVVAALLRRLLEIINGRRAATLTDLGLIGYAYVFVIATFAAVYLGADNFGGESFHHSNDFRAPLRIVDHLYLSGITIATVGYGDIVPRTAPTKLLVVLESMVGLWLTVTVLGVFIGSLLSRQLQDKQAQFFTDFQRDYVASIALCQTTVNSLEGLRPDQIAEFRRNVLETVARLVRLQYGPRPSAKVNANWMRFYRGREVPPHALEMVRGHVVPHLATEEAMRTVWGFLVLQEWDNQPPLMPGSGELVLPVYDPHNPALSKDQLLGAPQAVGSEEGYVIVSDATTVDLSNQHPDVARRLAEYFSERAKDLRSFASVRMGTRSDPAGVINIQSSEPDLCGTSPEAQRILVDMIQPFATYLALAGAEEFLGEEAAKP